MTNVRLRVRALGTLQTDRCQTREKKHNQGIGLGAYSKVHLPNTTLRRWLVMEPSPGPDQSVK